MPKSVREIVRKREVQERGSEQEREREHDERQTETEKERAK